MISGHSKTCQAADIAIPCEIMLALGELKGEMVRVFHVTLQRLFDNLAIPQAVDDRIKILGISKHMQEHHPRDLDCALHFAQRTYEHNRKNFLRLAEPAQTVAHQASAPDRDEPECEPVNARAGFLKPVVLPSLKAPEDEKNVGKKDELSHRALCSMLDDAFDRRGIAFSPPTNAVDGGKFSVRRKTLPAFCQTIGVTVSGWIELFVDSAAARKISGDASTLLAHWNELEGAAKAAMRRTMRRTAQASPARRHAASSDAARRGETVGNDHASYRRWPGLDDAPVKLTEVGAQTLAMLKGMKKAGRVPA